ncbi:MAG: sulfotransferase domain-containing protein [Phycisphaerales bacterium JB037]
MRMRPHLQRLSNTVNRFVSARYGEQFPFYYISEFPKSGGTWLARMVADALELPRPEKSIFPIGCAAVLHNHWPYHPKRKRTIYLYRDGRDLAVSGFFHRMRNMNQPDLPASMRAELKKRYDRLFGPGYDPADTRALLPRFIEDTYERPWGVRMTWTRHIESWYDPDRHAHVAFVSYEQLLEDCSGELARVIGHVAGKPLPDWKIDSAVEKFSIARQTGRKAGQEDRGHFIRKGIAGDWKNHFTREAAEVFDRYAGETLIRLGYEPDRSWVERVGAPEPAVGGVA